MIQGLLVGAAILSASVAGESLTFSQCECLLDSFSTDTSTFFPNNFVVGGDATGFECTPGVDLSGFPLDAGVVAAVGGGNISTLSSVTNNFFNAGGVRNDWSVRIKTSFVPNINVVPVIATFSDTNGITESVTLESFEQFFIPSVKLLYRGREAILSSVTPGEDFEITVGEQVVDIAGNNFDTTFACIGSTSVPTVCNVLDIPFSPFAGDVTVSLFPTDSVAEANDFTLKFVEFGGAVEVGQITNVNLDFAAAVGALVDPVVPVLPSFDVDSLAMTEDIPQAIDLQTDFLAGGNTAVNFVVDTSALLGEFNIPDTSAAANFLYLPFQDFNGDETFSFSYNIDSPNFCSSPDATVTLSIAPAADAPTAVNPTVDVFALIESNFSNLVVAEDVDFADELLDGGLATILTLPPGTVTDCDVTTLIVGSTLAIEDGAMTFCYTPDGTVAEGVVETMTFTISDQVAESADVTGQVTFVGANPVSVIADSVTVTNENTDVVIPMSTLVAVAAPELLFTVRILSLPPDGVLSDANGVPINVNDEIQNDETLTFTPNAGFFNANAEGGGETAAGESLIDPVIFSFEVFSGDNTDGPANAFIQVNAVDDFGANVVLGGAQDFLLVDVNDAVNGNVAISIDGASVTSDNGEQVFQVLAAISVNNGLSFTVANPSNVVGFVLENGSFDGDAVADCTVNPCDNVDITGVPFQVEEVFNSIAVNFPETTEDGDTRLVLSVEAIGEEVVRTAELQFISQVNILVIDNEVVETSEDTQVTFSAAELAEGSVDSITLLSDPVGGVLTVNDVAVGVGSIILIDANIVFIPDAEFFNANSDGSAETDAGVPIVGEASVTFQANFETLFNGPATLLFQVNAVDDGAAAIVNNGDDTFFLSEAGNGGFSRVNLNSFAVTSDNNNQVFDIAATISTAGGLQFNLVPEVARKLLTSGRRLGIEDQVDCTLNLCTEATLEGVPSEVTDALNLLDLNVPDNVVGGVLASISLDVVANDGDTTPATETVTVVGLDAVVAIENVEFTTDEDASVDLSVSSLVSTAVTDLAVSLRVASLPSFGTFTNGEGNAVQVGDEFNLDDVISFAPNDNFFNTFVGGVAVGANGVAIAGDSDFTFEALSADLNVVEGPVAASIFVNAVDDGGAEVVNNGEDAFNLDVEVVPNDNLPDAFADLAVSSDLGEDVFAISARILFNDGEGDIASPGVPSVTEGFTFVLAADATESFPDNTTGALLTGVPSQIQEALAGTTLNLPQEIESSVVVQVADLLDGSSLDDATNVTLTFTFFNSTQDEIDDNNNDGDDEGNGLFGVIEDGVIRTIVSLLFVGLILTVIAGFVSMKIKQVIEERNYDYETEDEEEGDDEEFEHQLSAEERALKPPEGRREHWDNVDDEV